MYSTKQKKFKDENLRSYCQSNENCLRRPLLQSVGDHSGRVSATTCCSVCSGGEIPYKHLDILAIGKSKPSKRKGPKIREIDDCMKSTIRSALIKEQSDFMLSECPEMGILGPESVCSDAIIDDICNNSRSIASVEDINYFLLRPELQSCFFIVLMCVVKDAPKPKQRRY